MESIMSDSSKVSWTWIRSYGFPLAGAVVTTVSIVVTIMMYSAKLSADIASQSKDIALANARIDRQGDQILRLVENDQALILTLREVGVKIEALRCSQDKFAMESATDRATLKAKLDGLESSINRMVLVLTKSP
jgi:hypothetical protein